jgi:hypothetical protein
LSNPYTQEKYRAGMKIDQEDLVSNF